MNMSMRAQIVSRAKELVARFVQVDSDHCINCGRVHGYSELVNEMTPTLIQHGISLDEVGM